MSSTPIWTKGQPVRVIADTDRVGKVDYVDVNPRIKFSIRVIFIDGTTRNYRPTELERAPAVVALGKVGP